MTSVEEQNYQVLITRESGHAAWHAVLVGMPAIFARAGSREEVIKEITEKLRTAPQHAEIITVTLPRNPSNGNLSQKERLAAMGWHDHGIFKDDPEALKLFDEIEEERNKHFIEPLQP